MDNQNGEVLSLSAENTGVNLQVLRGQVNYLQWWRDFQVVAQAKGFFDIITGREIIYAPPNASDFGFDEVEEVENIEDVDQDKGPANPTIVDGKIAKPDQAATTETPVIEKPKKDRKGRYSLSPYELSKIRDEASSSQDQGEKAATPTSKKLDLSSRLALYKFNLEAYEKSRKRVHQAMALLVYWVDPVIRGRLQTYLEPYAAVKYLESQYKMSEVRLQEAAANSFERVHLSKCKGVQDFLNKIENARQDILDSGGMCTEGMIISKIMRSLTSDFNSFVDHYHFFRDNDPGTLDLAQMTSRLLTFESDLQQRRANKTLMALTSASGKPKNEMKCDTCGKKGHNKDRCWQTYPHLKKSPQELQDARNKSKNEAEKIATPRKVLAVATTNLGEFNHHLSKTKYETCDKKNRTKQNCWPTNRRLSDIKCDMCDKKGHTKQNCWLAIPGQNKARHVCHSGVRRPHLRCKPSSSEPTGTKIDSQTQKQRESLVSKAKSAEEGYIGGSGNTGLDGKSGVQGVLLRPSHSLSNGKGVKFRTPDDFVPRFSNPTCMMLLGNNSTNMEQDKWILDSGANVHAVNDMKWFKDFHEFDMKVSTADDVNTLDILGGGTVEVSTMTDTNEKVTLELSKVAFSPGLRCNILSLSLLGKVGGLKGCWSTNNINIVTRNDEPVCSATEKDGLYVLNFSINNEPKTGRPTRQTHLSVPGGVKPPCIVATIDFREKVWKWHRRLGHLGLENLRRLLKVSEGMDLTDKEIKNKLGAVCPVCATSRALYTIPRDPATRRYKNPGDLLHVDGWGPYSLVGIGGVKGFVALTDEATRFVWTKPYKKREEIVSIFLEMLKMIETTHDITIRRVRMDNEFNTNRTEAYFTEKGITMESTAAYAHHQNGVAERNFRTERERAAAMIQENLLPQRIRNIILGSADELLKSSTAPEKLWPEAWRHATWIKIRSPTRALKSRKTPWELMTQHVPDLARERVWGSRTYVTVPPETRGPKLHAARGWMGYFMGCESESIYRIWNPDKNKIARITAARVDDGEGLDDPQDGPNRNDRVTNRTTPDRHDNEDSSDTDSSGTDSNSSDNNSNRSEALDNLIRDRPGAGAPREDAFMSGALQSDPENESDVEDAPINFEAPLNTGNNIAEETGTGDPPVPINSEPNTSEDSSSSSEGEASPYFQIQHPDIQMAKRKQNQTDGDKALKRTRKQGQPPEEKCASCFKKEYRCDGTYPFTEKCSHCVRKNTTCCPQGEEKKGLPKNQKCAGCFKDSRTCDGTPPFTTKCSNCAKRGNRCHPQGTVLEGVKLGKGHAQPKEDKCNRCATNGLFCDNKTPCGACIRNKWTCSYEKKPERRPRTERCNHCRRNNRRCDGKRPCNECKKKGINCVWTNDKESWVYRPDPATWPKPTQMDRCHQCRNDLGKYFGGSPHECDGGFPCICCKDNDNNGNRSNCTYHLGNGISKKYKLENERAQKVRNYDKERSVANRKLWAKRKNSETKDSSDEDGETDDDLIFHHQNNDTSDDDNGGDMDQGGQADNHDDPNSPDEPPGGASDKEPNKEPNDSQKEHSNQHSDQHSGQQHSYEKEDENGSNPQSPEWGNFENPSNATDNNSNEENMEDSQYFTDDAAASNHIEEPSDDENRNERSSLLNLERKNYSFQLEPKPFRQTREHLGWSSPLDPHSDKNVKHPEHNKSKDCVICLAEMALDPEPRNRGEALRRQDADKWTNAMQDEYNSLLKNKTWEVVDRPKNQHVLSNRWVLRRKLGADGSVAKYKARFVARGFEQIYGVDFDETFASVVKQPSYKILFALQAMLGWKCHQMDVKTAFLHGEVDEVIYIEPPNGFPEKDGKVLRLLKALYGLKQSPRQWYLRLKKFLTTKGWRVSNFDSSVFMHPSGLFLTVYVDDINIFGENENDIIEFKKTMSKEFEMTDLGQCAYYLGLHVHVRPEGIYLHQASFIQQILNRFSLNDINPVSTPTNPTSKLTANKNETASQDFTRLYQAMVGSVNYLATVSRPDISFATSRIARYMSNPSDEHMKELHRLYAYLKGSKNLGLMFPSRSTDNIQGMVDSDWGNCPDTSRSTGGWIFTLGGSPISWSSKRQPTVALSSCEAEYMAASEATKEAIWIRNLVREFKLPIFNNLTIPLAIDNNSAMKLSKNPEFHARTKHIAMRHHFIREKVASEEVAVTRVDTKDNLADTLTKGLPRPRLQDLIERMGMKIGPLPDS